jgi:[acyl-carrier-protein] S-malonyltransferase
LNSLKIPIISNVNVDEIKDSNVIKNLLIDQIYKKVRWREIIEYMLKKNVLEFVEIGPGKTLSGMLKRFKKDIVIRNFNNMEDMNS